MICRPSQTPCEAMATCEDTVLHYMQTQNRPFSVTNIVDALQSSGFKKPTITRALESLAANGQLISVNEGKVYLAAQSDAAAVGDEVRGTWVVGTTKRDTRPSNALFSPFAKEVAQLETDNARLTAQVSELKARASALQGELRSMGNMMTTEQLVTATAKLDAECAALETRLQPLRDGSSAAAATPEEREFAEKLALLAFDTWSSRRKAFKELWGAVCEATDKSTKVLRADVPYDDDEGAGHDYEEAKKAITALKAARFKAGRK